MGSDLESAAGPNNIAAILGLPEESSWLEIVLAGAETDERMRDHDNLAALIDDAGALADQFCSSLPGSGSGNIGVESPLPAKAGSYREMLYCRFADQAFSAARSARHGRPVSTSSLTRSAFETFTRLHELRDHLESAFRKGSLDGLDGLITVRLFGAEEEEGEEGFSLQLAEDEDAPEMRAHPVADNDSDDDHEFQGIDPGACAQDTQAEQALRRLMRTLIAIETSFDNCYRALDESMQRLDEMFAARSRAHG
ncbi:MAG: hypothetical protein J7498_10105 [Sphingobium sp.]|nr:hypothetical protein [Sphingobium sp.]